MQGTDFGGGGGGGGLRPGGVRVAVAHRAGWGCWCGGVRGGLVVVYGGRADGGCCAPLERGDVGVEMLGWGLQCTVFGLGRRTVFAVEGNRWHAALIERGLAGTPSPCVLVTYLLSATLSLPQHRRARQGSRTERTTQSRLAGGNMLHNLPRRNVCAQRRGCEKRTRVQPRFAFKSGTLVAMWRLVSIPVVHTERTHGTTLLTTHMSCRRPDPR